jgi:hypothetical protein
MIKKPVLKETGFFTPPKERDWSGRNWVCS